MKKMFIEAHKMTREMVEKYGVDYQAQFGLNLSYLLEKEEEKEMLEKGIKKELLEMGFEEEVERAEGILSKYNELTEELVKDMYNDRDIRRAMKSRKMWNDKDLGVEMFKRYLGEGKVEISRQKLWAKGDKVRIYFDILVDDIFEITGSWIKVK